MRPSPTIAWRELVPLALVACLLAAAMHWPVTLHLSRDVASDLGDPLDQAWQVAWSGHALTHEPLDLFQANIYWPLENSLAFLPFCQLRSPTTLMPSAVSPRASRIGGVRNGLPDEILPS